MNKLLLFAVITTALFTSCRERNKVVSIKHQANNICMYVYVGGGDIDTYTEAPCGTYDVGDDITNPKKNGLQ